MANYTYKPSGDFYKPRVLSEEQKTAQRKRAEVTDWWSMVHAADDAQIDQRRIRTPEKPF